MIKIRIKVMTTKNGIGTTKSSKIVLFNIKKKASSLLQLVLPRGSLHISFLFLRDSQLRNCKRSAGEMIFCQLVFHS